MMPPVDRGPDPATPAKHAPLAWIELPPSSPDPIAEQDEAPVEEAKDERGEKDALSKKPDEAKARRGGKQSPTAPRNRRGTRPGPRGPALEPKLAQPSAKTPESQASLGPESESKENEGGLLSMRAGPGRAQAPGPKPGPRPAPKHGRGDLLGNASDLASAVAPVVRPRRDADLGPRYPKTKKIGKYTFERAGDGRLTYRDPQEDFLAVLLDDGQVEFESRSSAVGGICAAGLCVTAGGLRKKNERKRKNMNRVRVRFAPVLVGLAINFGSTRGIPKKQLDFLHETFDARLRMRLRVAKRRRNKRLKHLSQEFARIWRIHPRKRAKSLLMDKVLELEPPYKPPQNPKVDADPLLVELYEQERHAVDVICERLLRMMRRNQSPAEPQGFGPQELARIEARCKVLRD